VNLPKNKFGYNRIKKVTMSLYIMIEIKDQESNSILSKHTVCQRIYEQVHDFRKHTPLQ
jgi:hypothetical protein